MVASTASVATASASRYLQQLCKHWAHNLEVSFDPSQGRVVFPKNGRGSSWPEDGIFTMTATPTDLQCRLEASSTEQLTGLQGAVERHLNRFAFREGELHFYWQSA